MTTPQQYETKYQAGLENAKGNLERFLSEDGTNVYDPNKIWQTDKPPITAGDVNALLDNGAFGLEWFRLALVRYHRVWDLMQLDGFDEISIPPLPIAGELNGAETINTKDSDPNEEMIRLQGKYYDQQRSMKLASLRDLATAITGAALGNGADPGGSQITSDLSQLAGAVPEYWEGQGGAAAGDHLSGFHAHADQKTQYLQALSSALNGLPEVLRQIVADKANFIAGFDSSECPVAGHAMRLDGAEDMVSIIITVAAGKGGYSFFGQRDTSEVSDQFHLKKDDQAEQTAKDWLINHFGPAVREAFKAFVHQCVLADYYIRSAYKPVIDLLDSNDTTPFPKPPGGENPDQPAPGPAPSGPGPAPGPATMPTSVAPTLPETTTPTTPAGTQTNPAQQLLSNLATQAGQTVQQGVTQTLQQGLGQIQNVAQQGLGALGGNLSSLGAQLPGAGPQLSEVKAPGTKQLANLSAFGGNLEVSQAADGTITAKVTGPDGKPQEYSMGIKDGMPFLKPGPAEADQASDDSAHGAGSGTDAGGPGPGPGGGGGPSQSGTPADSVDPNAMQGHSVDPPAGKSDSNAAPQPSGPGGSDPAQQGMPGMPGPGPGGAKPGSEGERSSNGLVPPKPLWTNVPGDGPPNPDGTIGSAPELATSGPLDGPPQASAGPELATSGPLNASHTADQAKSTPPAAAPNSGVKIEVDTGESK